MKFKLMEKIKGKGKTIAVLAAVIVVAVIAVPRLTADKEPTYAETMPPTVDAVNPKTGSIELESSLIGTVEPAVVEYVFPEIAGEVTSVNVKAGQRVSAGQVICTIENKQLDSAGINFQTAQLNLTEAQNAMNRAEVLYESGDISTQSYEDTKNALEKARLSYQSASDEYNNQSGYSRVTAKTSGLVESCDVEVFDNVNTQTQLCVISGGDEKVITFEVTERIVKNINTGDKIVVEKNGTEYEGSVTEVSTMVDAASGLFKVKASLGSDAALATGASAKVYVISDKAQSVMTIPAGAVYYENGQALVYVYQDGKAKKVFIEAGISDAENLEVTSGLKNTDLVISTWTSELYDGAEVSLSGQQ